MSQQTFFPLALSTAQQRRTSQKLLFSVETGAAPLSGGLRRPPLGHHWRVIGSRMRTWSFNPCLEDSKAWFGRRLSQTIGTYWRQARPLPPFLFPISMRDQEWSISLQMVAFQTVSPSPIEKSCSAL